MTSVKWSFAGGGATLILAKSCRVWKADSYESTWPCHPSFTALRILRDKAQPPITAESVMLKVFVRSANGSNSKSCFFVNSFHASCTLGCSDHSNKLNEDLVTPLGPYLWRRVSFHDNIALWVTYPRGVVSALDSNVLYFEGSDSGGFQVVPYQSAK